jgi:hypothetical protein
MKLLSFLFILSNIIINGLNIENISSYLNIKKGEKGHMFGKIINYQDKNISYTCDYGNLKIIYHTNGNINWHWYIETEYLETKDYYNKIVFLNKNETTNVSFIFKIFNQNPKLIIRKKFIRYDDNIINNIVNIYDKFKYINVSLGNINYKEEDTWIYYMSKEKIIKSTEIKIQLFVDDNYYTVNNFFIINNENYVYYNLKFDIYISFNNYFIDCVIMTNTIKNILHLDSMNIICNEVYTNKELKHSISILNINELDCFDYNKTISNIIKNKKIINYLLNFDSNEFDIYMNNTRIENNTFIYRKDNLNNNIVIYVFMVYLLYIILYEAESAPE